MKELVDTTSDPRWRGKLWHELSPSERVEVSGEDFALYRAMFKARIVRRRFANLSSAQREQLHREDPALYARMKEDRGVMCLVRAPRRLGVQIL